MSSRRRTLLVIGLGALFSNRFAAAGGIYFSDRGVRANARGGAFVAGADDFDAVWYNPAGLTEAGRSFYADFTWLHFSSSFKRQTQVIDSQGNPHIVTSPAVEGTTPFLPLPTLGATFVLREKNAITAAFGVYAPYSTLLTYPLSVDGQPAPQRYSVVTMDGSILATLGAWIAAKPIPEISVGAGLQLLTGTFASQVVFNANPNDRLIGAPEDPNYDALSQLNAGPILAPSANAGVTFIPHKAVRIGLSAQAPFVVNAPGTIQVKLPNAVLFDNARQEGNDVRVKFSLPAIFRVGVEVKPTERLRLEATYVREQWVNHRSIDIEPRDVRLYGITGFPEPFRVAPISIPRQFESSNSVRLGGEFTVKLDDKDEKDKEQAEHAKLLDLRLGARYETSAIPPAYLTALTLDMNKIVVGAGVGLHLGRKWRFDATFANVFASDVHVDPAEAKSPRVNPVKGNPTATEAVNGGDYSVTAFMIGLGVNYRY